MTRDNYRYLRQLKKEISRQAKLLPIMSDDDKITQVRIGLARMLIDVISAIDNYKFERKQRILKKIKGGK